MTKTANLERERLKKTRRGISRSMNEYQPAKSNIKVSTGESVRILRELQELSQTELSELTGISQATILDIENDRTRLGIELAKVIARALKCHPAVVGAIRASRRVRSNAPTESIVGFLF